MFQSLFEVTIIGILGDVLILIVLLVFGAAIGFRESLYEKQIPAFAFGLVVLSSLTLAITMLVLGGLNNEALLLLLF